MVWLYNYAYLLDDNIRSSILFFRPEFGFAHILGADKGSLRSGCGAPYAKRQPKSRVAKSEIDGQVRKELKVDMRDMNKERSEEEPCLRCGRKKLV